MSSSVPNLPNSVITGYTSDGRPIWTAYATQPTQPAPEIPARWFNAWDFFQVGDGNDYSLMCNRALTACAAAGGGVVYLPGGTTYTTAGSIIIPGDNITLRGDDWSTIIQPVAGATFDAICTPVAPSAGANGYIRNYVAVENLAIDCSNMTGTQAGSGNGIHYYGVRYGRIRRVFVKSCPNWAILLDGDNTAPGKNFGYDNLVSECIFDLCAANVYQSNCEANDYTNNRFKWCGGTTAAAQPANGSQDTTGYHLRLGSGYAYVAGNVFGKGGSYTTPAIITFNNGPCRIIGNRFDQVRNQAVTLNAGNHEFCYNALGSPGSAISGVPAIQLGSSNNRVVGNSFDTTAGGANYTYCVAESGGPFTGNIIADNALIAGTGANGGLISLNATSTARVHHNPPYNPRGASVAQLAVATSGTPLTNTTGCDCMVLVGGGTITQIALGGTNTGQTSGWFRVPAGGTITLTYSAAPTTFQWFGD